jgi:hypothetical protein
MKTCAICHREITPDKYFTRKSVCAECGADLHICLNCSFYSETAHNKCIETKADFQRSRDRSNFCEYFSYRESDAAGASSSKEDTMKKLNDLFRK